MGKLFTVDGREVWSKAQGTSQMFCGQIALLEKYVIQQPSGVVDTGWDEVRIDPPVLRDFLLAAFHHLREVNGSWHMHAMVRGVLQVALELDERASGERLTLPDWFKDITDAPHVCNLGHFEVVGRD
ncbi:DUF6086 family protein [Kutzneria kofuensis]|uniref:Uncharacterized protein n=1 Tax=Kutzneria kofuensis TaxID=103725 RepID=A0A7W9KMI1_9PSEU|nr:DUF6086 family protein [Kutzneria kofuensis]MBB5895304.1 hypothetical protein [Kutzneria kofuensis]